MQTRLLPIARLLEILHRRNGVFLNNVHLTLDRSTISSNSATNHGGGIINTNGAATITNSTISDNSAGTGGGIYSYGMLISISNSTLSGNTANFGGGIYHGCLNFNGIFSIRNTTITNNSTGVLTYGLYGTLGFYSSIVVGNGTSDVSGSCISSLGWNLIGNSSTSVFNKPGDQVGVSAVALKLGPLADNGGPTKPHVPLAGSQAIDAGDPEAVSVPATDQCGAPFNRVYGGRIDVGAVERQPIPNTVMGDYNHNGIVDAADFVLWRKTLGTTGISPFTNADGSGNGVVDQADYTLWRSNYGSIVPLFEVGSGADVDLGPGEFPHAATGSAERIIDACECAWPISRRCEFR